ncbi:hypothetical protein [Uliginosibacterium sp. H1]|uniref:hypothetical protein n=1 Tax=Uliginosibacterium sp. H1 TaxID=3114757 RepID=UPI002E19C210|nr:hypothetical protein [Uliginosibacterium sp. H1]
MNAPLSQQDQLIARLIEMVRSDSLLSCVGVKSVMPARAPAKAGSGCVAVNGPVRHATGRVTEALTEKNYRASARRPTMAAGVAPYSSGTDHAFQCVATKPRRNAP